MSATAQQTTEMATSTRWFAPALPEKLSSLIDRITEVFDVENLPALSPDDRRAAQQALMAYRDMPSTSSPRLINRLMTTMAVAFPNQRLSEQEADLRIEVYTKALANIAPDLLSGGVLDVVQSSKFFPTVAEIRAAALRQPMGPHRWRAFLLGQLLRKPQPVAIVNTEAAERADVVVRRLAIPAPQPAGVDAYIELGLSPEEAAAAVEQHRAALKRADDADRRAGEARVAARNVGEGACYDPPG